MVGWWLTPFEQFEDTKLQKEQGVIESFTIGWL